MRIKGANEVSEQSVLLLTVKQAAERLQCGINRTYGLANTGVLPCIRIGNSIRIPASALDRWIQDNTGKEL